MQEQTIKRRKRKKVRSNAISLPPIIQTIRLHHWTKNALLFVPLITAHEFNDIAKLSNCLIGFFAFSFCASAGYIFNDICDQDADRAHARKKQRPLAAGTLPPKLGLTAIPLLLGGAFFLARDVAPAFLSILLMYFALSCLYSLQIKKIIVLDVLLLASFYSMRIIAGGLCTEIWVSEWLIAFSMFFFLSLALGKRYIELAQRPEDSSLYNLRRGYKRGDKTQLGHLGSVSGYLAVLILALYLSTPRVASLYSTPELLWLICGLLLYWISRFWILAARGEVSDDPVTFAIKDAVSYSVLAMSLFSLAFAI